MRPGTFWLFVSVCCLLSNCSGGSNTPNDTTPSLDGSTEQSSEDGSGDTPELLAPGHCSTPEVRILRVNPWLGSGMQVYVEVAPQTGTVLGDGSDSGEVEADVTAADNVDVQPDAAQADTVDAQASSNRVPVVTASLVNLTPVPSAVEASPVDRGLVGLLLVPTDNETGWKRGIDEALALVSGLAAADNIALWTLDSEGLVLLADLTNNHQHVRDRLAQERSSARSGKGSPDAAVSAAREALAEAEGRWGAVSKYVVVIGAPEPPVSPPVDPVPAVPALYLCEAGEGTGTSFTWATMAESGLAGAEVADFVRKARENIWLVGACAAAEEDGQVALTVNGIDCLVEAPKPAAHLVHKQCVAEDAARDSFPYLDEIELVLTTEEKQVFDDRHAAESKDDFRLSVRLGDALPLPATAHFRGQTSMNCVRKNYDINLDGGSSRRLMPGAGGDEFYLISMCKDEGYFNQVFANAVLADMGVFPLKSKLIRLRLNGSNQGVYLLMEHPTESLVKDSVGLDAVLRRPFEPDDDLFVEVKHSTWKNPADALAPYDDLTEAMMDGPVEDIAEVMGRSMDVDSYLGWMAFMTFMVNGDYVDEVFFYGSIETDGIPFWRILNWDADDLFSNCHHGGQFALPDPNGLLYCAEGFIDHGIIRSPEIYSRYVDKLEFIINNLPPERLEQEMYQVRDDLYLLIDDETASVLVDFHKNHPSATTGDAARSEISTLMAKALTDAEASRNKLLGRIENWRSAQ